ncbi:lantibiotic dehydratase, partial [Massilia sp. DJPM01]|uniref:lantibiotic dehydratase n=1 Tax=Massilia sp. DJPM01 TaxID=3024404 RepID=UPI00259F5913
MKSKFLTDRYAVVRRPALSEQWLDSITQQLQQKSDLSTSDIVRAIMAVPNVESAMEIAHPELNSKLKSAELVNKDPALAISLYKYFCRMATRCTPYSAFAAVSLLTEHAYERPSNGTTLHMLELDCGILYQYEQLLKKNAVLSVATRARINPTAYLANDNVRFFERKLNGEIFNSQLASISRTSYIDAIYMKLSRPSNVDEILAALSRVDPKIQTAEYLIF